MSSFFKDEHIISFSRYKHTRDAFFACVCTMFSSYLLLRGFLRCVSGNAKYLKISDILYLIKISENICKCVSWKGLLASLDDNLAMYQ